MRRRWRDTLGGCDGGKVLQGILKLRSSQGGLEQHQVGTLRGSDLRTLHSSSRLLHLIEVARGEVHRQDDVKGAGGGCAAQLGQKIRNLADDNIVHGGHHGLQKVIDVVNAVAPLMLNEVRLDLSQDSCAVFLEALHGFDNVSKVLGRDNSVLLQDAPAAEHTPVVTLLESLLATLQDESWLLLRYFLKLHAGGASRGSAT
mmetsp:Transcript_66780/g.159766  ORF Transcript_66780/g.159766 Transcript_66780/m.159766 type:complete len:201 (+) Transcript_66780:2539-3141(+)